MSNKLTTLLTNHCFSVYDESASDTEVALKCRLVPLNEADISLTLAETYALKFIKEALAIPADDSWSFEAVRPWLLKDGKLVYTWKFILKGSVESAYNALSRIEKAPTQDNTFVRVNKSVSKRGTVTVRR